MLELPAAGTVVNYYSLSKMQAVRTLYVWEVPV